MIGSLTYLGTFNGAVSGGSKIFFDVPCRGRYNTFYIVATKTAGAAPTDVELAAAVGDIEGTINGFQAVKINGVNMAQIAQSMNVPLATAGGIIAIPLYCPNYDLYAERYNFTWALSKVQTATLTINIKSAAAVLRYDLYADWSGNDTDPLGAFQCYGTQILTAGAAQFDNNSLNTYGSDAIVQGHYLSFVGGTNPTIANVYVDADNNTIMNNALPSISLIGAQMSKYTIPTMVPGGYPAFPFVQIWDGANKPTSGLITAGIAKLRLRATLGGDAVATSLQINTRYIKGAVIGK